MAEENKTNIDVMSETMPGADPVSPEDKEGFKVDLNFDEVAPTEEEIEQPEDEEEVEFPAEEVVEEEAKIVFHVFHYVYLLLISSQHVLIHH